MDYFQLKMSFLFFFNNLLHGFIAFGFTESQFITIRIGLRYRCESESFSHQKKKKSAFIGSIKFGK